MQQSGLYDASVGATGRSPLETPHTYSSFLPTTGAITSSTCGRGEVFYFTVTDPLQAPTVTVN